MTIDKNLIFTSKYFVLVILQKRSAHLINIDRIRYGHKVREGLKA